MTAAGDGINWVAGGSTALAAVLTLLSCCMALLGALHEHKLCAYQLSIGSAIQQLQAPGLPNSCTAAVLLYHADKLVLSWRTLLKYVLLEALANATPLTFGSVLLG
jgi:hypothetical protein